MPVTRLGAIPDGVLPAPGAVPPGAGKTSAQFPANSDLAGEVESCAVNDEQHESACNSLRAAMSRMDMHDPATYQRMINHMREPGWPDPLEVAKEAARTPRAAIYDHANGRGGEGAFFRAQLPGPWRYLVEHNFDVMLMGGLHEPSMMIRLVAHQVRVCAHFYADTHDGHELFMVANVFEQYPSQAVDYAAEWSAHFAKRMGRAR